jgi:hypothetical protein
LDLLFRSAIIDAASKRLKSELSAAAGGSETAFLFSCRSEGGALHAGSSAASRRQIVLLLIPRTIGSSLECAPPIASIGPRARRLVCIYARPGSTATVSTRPFQSKGVCGTAGGPSSGCGRLLPRRGGAGDFCTAGVLVSTRVVVCAPRFVLFTRTPCRSHRKTKGKHVVRPLHTSVTQHLHSAASSTRAPTSSNIIGQHHLPLRQGEWYPQLAIIVKHSVRIPINNTYTSADNLGLWIRTRKVLCCPRAGLVPDGEHSVLKGTQRQAIINVSLSLSPCRTPVSN